MVMTLADCAAPLQNPKSGLPPTARVGCLASADGGEHYPVVNELPLPIDHEAPVASRSATGQGAANRVRRPKKGNGSAAVKRLLSPTRRETVESTGRFVTAVKELRLAPLVLVIGRGPSGRGTEALYSAPARRLLSSDIHARPHNRRTALDRSARRRRSAALRPAYAAEASRPRRGGGAISSPEPRLEIP